MKSPIHVLFFLTLTLLTSACNHDEPSDSSSATPSKTQEVGSIKTATDAENLVEPQLDADQGKNTQNNRAVEVLTKGDESLPAKDQELLNRLLKDFLFDPKGAQRVRVRAVRRSVWGESITVERDGWLVKGQTTSPDRVYFIDSESMLITEKTKFEEVDFLAACRDRFNSDQTQNKTEDQLRRARFRQMSRNAIGEISQLDLVFAVWLRRLGHDRLAATALKRARSAAQGDDKEMVSTLRNDLAWSAFAGLVHAYMVRADEEALASGERLLKLYRQEADQYPQAPKIIADLKRRQTAGTFGKAKSTSYPKESKDWDINKKISFLIGLLDDVDARQMGQPGSVTLAMDSRVMSLILIGDPAIPALIDTIEKDTRLTRSVHAWRDFSRDRTVLGVREAALEAVMTILKVQFFESRSTGDNFTSHGDSAAKQVASRLKAYWKKFGGMPFDERMMKVLTDVDARFESTREAAYNLAHLRERRMLSTSGARITFSSPLTARFKQSNSAVEKFSDPTAAEAILAAMDRDLGKHDAMPRDDLYDYRRREIEDTYLTPLIDLGDKRIASELRLRYKTANTIRSRRKWANAAHHLGDPEAMKEFARDIEIGKLDLPRNNNPNTNDDDQPGNVELRGIIKDLTGVGTPEADRALFALADPEHPYYEIASSRVLTASSHWGDGDAWHSHPFCLKILRKELDNKKITGRKFRIEGETLIEEGERGGFSSSDIPSLLKDPDTRKSEADVRYCDRAAEKIHQLIIGLPLYHPLQKDADKELDSLKRVFDSFRNGYRRVTPLEAEFLGVFSDDAAYIPDMPPLGRPAREKDVKEGKAIFHLDGKGELAKLSLPAVASLVKGGNEATDEYGRPRLAIIIQAEVDTDGDVLYGIIGDGVGRTAKADELTDIKPIKKKSLLFKLFN